MFRLDHSDMVFRLQGGWIACGDAVSAGPPLKHEKVVEVEEKSRSRSGGNINIDNSGTNSSVDNDNGGKDNHCSNNSNNNNIISCSSHKEQRGTLCTFMSVKFDK